MQRLRPTRLRPNQTARLILLVSVVVTVLLYFVPYGLYLAYPLMLLSTLAHEMGHGVTAVLVGGDFERFLMWPDGSGVAELRTSGHRLQQAAVAAGGLVGPAVAAGLGFFVGRSSLGSRRALFAIAFMLGLSMLFVVRGGFALMFVTIVAFGCFLVARNASAEMAQLALIFLSVQLALSVFSRGEYLFTAEAATGGGTMPSDSSLIAQALFLPYWFWGALCGAFSILVLIVGLRAYWR